MTHDAIVNRLLDSCLSDWIQPHEVSWLAKSVGGAETLAEIQDMSLKIIRHLLEDDLVVAGDLLEGGFKAWDVSPREAFRRIETKWSTYPGGPSLGDLCWFDLTEKGEQRAREVTQGKNTQG
jgi:hypothetical protein